MEYGIECRRKSCIIEVYYEAWDWKKDVLEEGCFGRRVFWKKDVLEERCFERRV